jgi:tetratricopeptide (TPR) repeat protein
VNRDLVALLKKGYSSQQEGNLRDAEKVYLKVLKRDKVNEFALNLLGVVCVRTGRNKEAIGYLQRALSANDSDAETYNNLGLAYKGLKQFAEAQSALERSIQMNPRQPETLNNLGNILASIDRHDQAISYFESALSLDQQHVGCLNNLSVSLNEVGRLADALQVIEHAIGVDKDRSRSHNNKGELLLQATQYEKAKEAFTKAIALDGNIVAKINLSTALKQLGDEQAAVNALEEVLVLEENNAEALNRLGVLHEQLGDMEQAAKCFRLAIKNVPNHASAFYQLSKLKGERLSQSEIDKISAMLRDPKLLDRFKSSLHFALACEYEKQGKFETSIDYFSKAQASKASRNTYNYSAMAEYIEASRRCFPVHPKSTKPDSDDLPIPVFIIGMPRSGTTLTEQIISSHSEVTGAGEVGFINDLLLQASEMTQEPYPRSVALLNREQLGELRTSYLLRMVQRSGSCRYIVDKNPLNFNTVGLIATVFPEARFLYCKRDPMDNCVSIFRLPFDDNQGYSHDLSALGHYYRQHEELMMFWMGCYSDQILQVVYEKTVEDLESQASAMLEFIGVEFEVQVLSFFDNERIVMTPSAEQVRQPIYKTSINSWQRYGDALAPLVEALRA